MERKRHHLVVILLSWLIIAGIGAYTVMEKSRMAGAEERQLDISLERGLELYARNCSSCHGPSGEGCIGMPLNRKEYRVDPEKNRGVVDFLNQTISNGRPGRSIPHWVKGPGGNWVSYTAMPAFARASGGALNEMHIQDLVSFIMLGDWNKVSAKVREIDAAAEEGIRHSGGDPAEVLKFRDAPGLSEAANRRGQELFTKYGCVGCHRVGARGSNIGADLSFVGSWGVPADFLRNWIRNAPEVENRLPFYWSNYGPEVDAGREPLVPPVKTVMPPFTTMPDEDLNDLVKWLMALTMD